MKRARWPGLAIVASVAALSCGGSSPSANANVGFHSGTGAEAQATSSCMPGQPCPPPPPPGCAPGQPCPPPSCPPGQACAPPSQGPLGTVYTTDPNALASLLAAAAAAGAALLGPGGALGDPAEAGVRAAAAQHAPGMTPDGQIAKGTLAEGGHLDFVVNMEPTRCYAIVAYGAGITDLDVNLLAPPFYNLLAAQDGMAGPTAVLGAAPRPMCPILPVTVPYKVDLHAKKGAGPVAAQLFSKPR